MPSLIVGIHNLMVVVRIALQLVRVCVELRDPISIVMVGASLHEHAASHLASSKLLYITSYYNLYTESIILTPIVRGKVYGGRIPGAKGAVSTAPCEHMRAPSSFRGAKTTTVYTDGRS